MLSSKNLHKDLGKLRKGIPFKFKYYLENEGNSDVRINKITVGCGSCTKASTSKIELKPGEVSTIDVTFTPGSIGPQLKYIYVKWNEDKQLKLDFTAESYE